MSSKFRSVLEATTNIAVLLMAIAVSAFFLTNYYRQRQVAKAPELELGLEKGLTLPLIQGVNFADSGRTLLIVMNTQCGYCADSVQFYNRVMDAQVNAKSPVRILALFPNSGEEVRKFVDERHLKVDAVSRTDLVKLKLTGTPTLVLVDDAGRICDFWVGKLTPDNEDQVIKSVTDFRS